MQAATAGAIIEYAVAVHGTGVLEVELVGTDVVPNVVEEITREVLDVAGQVETVTVVGTVT